MHRVAIYILGCLTLFLVALQPARACAIIIPPHPHPIPEPIHIRPAIQPMQVKLHKVSIDIRDQVARVSVRAVFHNPNGSRIEGTYYFPISPDAAVNSFTMTVNGKTMEADLLPADKARQIYEDIVRQQKDPAILEYIDQGMLRARVFPIEPQADITVELSYDQRVPYDGSLSRFRYPLISARPQQGPIQSLVIEATLDGKSPLKTVFVPGYDASVTRKGDTGARIGFESSNLTPEREFEIVFSRQPGRVGVDFLPYHKAKDGYFLMLISPRSELQAEEIVAKDITFVVDTSGSMQGDKIKQAQEALRFCIQSLNERDSFNIISFATEPVPLSATSLPVTEANTAKALAFIDDMRARGGTAINDALTLALASERARDKVPLLVFLTDGLPTIGEVDPDAILSQVQGKDVPRLFTFGVGHDVNTRIVNGLARSGRGFPTYVQPKEDLEVALSAFYERVASPVMTDLRLEMGDLQFTQMSPPTLPDLFRGTQIAVTGRFNAETTTGKHTVVLSGAVGDKREKFTYEIDLAHDALNSYVPRLWAMQRIGFLQEQIRLNGEKQELVDEIRALSREFGIISGYSSFLIVEEGLQANHRDRVRRALDEERQQMNRESGASAVDDAATTESMKLAGSGRGGAAAPAPGVYMDMDELRAADSSGAAEAADDATVLRQYVVTVEDRAFYRRADDGFLYDSHIPKGTTPKPDIEVQAWSDAFFALLRKNPELRHYLRAGTNIVVVLDGQVIRIHE